MALSPLPFMTLRDIDATPPHYEWSEQVYEKLEKYRSTNLKRVLLQMSGHADLAFAAGVAEWVCRRLEGFANCRPILNYLEAIWAAMIDPRYLGKKRIGDVVYTWTDPASDVAMVTGHLSVLSYFDCKALDPDRFADTAQLVAVARHALPDKAPFESWAEQTLARLRSLFPSSQGLGPPVPRNAIDIDSDFDSNRMPTYLNSFLEQLSPAANEFLADPEALALLPDFRGVPYKSIE
jgi:hypothetical protein